MVWRVRGAVPGANRHELAWSVSSSPPRASLDRASIQVVVCPGTDRLVGLVVGRILDVVEATVAARSPRSRPGVLYTAVVQDRVTEFLDVEHLVRSADPTPAVSVPTTKGV